MEKNNSRVSRVLDFLVGKVNTVWILLLLCGLNLLVMHYYIITTCHVDAELDIAFLVDNVVGISVDILFVFYATYWLSCRRLRIAFILCFLITLLWSLSNVMYSRFFFNYLTISAVQQGGALADNLILQCVIANIHLIDIYYIIVALLFVVFFLSLRHKCSPLPVKKLFIGFFFIILVDIGAHVLYCAVNPQLRYSSYVLHRIYSNHFVDHLYYSNPKLAHFLRGEVRSVSAELYATFQGNRDITDEQNLVIKEVESASEASLSTNNKSILPTNVIFILVESYMSFTSDMKVNGKEVTPFLNALKRDSSVYYNGRMQKNVALGSSSDGQFIYMTGLLPLRSVITLSKVRHTTMPGLPKVLEKESRMIIPTVASMWNQDEMCRQYGFDFLYSSETFEKGINSTLSDEQVFKFAIQKDSDSKQPFLSVILTLSMHQPYKKQIDTTFPVKETSMTRDLANYLNVCHYTDRQIEMYFKFLKRSGLYDKSLIIIAADHPVGNHNFGNVSDDIPLYIINSSVSPKNMWQGECNQVDVYTTLLDLLGCTSDWYGLGHSLVSPDYKNSVSNRTWDVSEWIIMGDYFSKK